MPLTSTQTTAINAYGKFLQSGMTYGEAMRKAASELGGTPCPTFLEALAKVHAQKYTCNYTWNASGNAVFYEGKESTRESRNEPARKSWERNVMVWFKAPKKPTPTTAHNRISKAHREAAMAFLGEFEGKDLQAQINAAIAVLKAMK